jgi:pimeloyl-ACP methyl ester carboxylesterase
MYNSYQRIAFLFLLVFAFTSAASSVRAQDAKPPAEEKKVEDKKSEDKKEEKKAADKAADKKDDKTVSAPVQTGKAPIIIIPGLTGSELVNGKNQEIVWFRPQRAKDDDLRLPISPNLTRNRDSLRARDIIRSVEFIKFLPEIEIYQKLIDALQQRGGYMEGKWDAPAANGYEDTFYVFPYDWRLDNVENARLLMQKVEALKRKLKRPDLKFNVIAHSMGGLIARYAAMYGNADIPRGKPRPTWAGARSFNRMFLLGTPNQGSIQAFDSILNGFSFIGGGINLPFVQNLSKFDVFTIPSIYQLLPPQGAFTAYDENLKPVPIDIYNPATWEKYDWSIWKDTDFAKKFSLAEQRSAKAYFTAALTRAKRFQEALDANTSAKPPVTFYLMGADCKDTQTAILLLRNEKKNRWDTHFKASAFERSNGEKVTSEDLKKLLYAQGDGVVTVSSLKKDAAKNTAVLPIASELYQCETHNRLVTNPEIQDKLFDLLGVNIAATAAAK